MHRQGVGALDEVVAGGLAQLLVGGGHVEQVVDDLERHAEAAPEGGEGVDLGPGQLGDDAADATGRGQQRGRLAVDGGEVGLLGAAQVEGALDLEDLALAQLGDGGGEQPGDLGAERRRDLRRLGQQVVAGEDRLEVAPAGVHAVDRAPGRGVVHDVVVVERAEVHQLHRHRAEHDLRRGGAHHVVGGGRRGDGEGGPHPLAAGEDQVAGDLGEERVVGHHRGPEGLLHPAEVGLEHGQLEEGGGGRHAGKVRRARSVTLNPAPVRVEDPCGTPSPHRSTERRGDGRGGG